MYSDFEYVKLCFLRTLNSNKITCINQQGLGSLPIWSLAIEQVQATIRPGTLWCLIMV